MDKRKQKPDFRSDKEYRLDPVMFRKRRLPLLLCFLAPSILLDVFLLHIVLQIYPQMIASGEMQASAYTWQSIQLFLTNALFLKGIPIYWYFKLKSFCLRSPIIRTVQGDIFFVRLRRETMDIGAGDTRFFDLFQIQNISALTRKKDGSVIVHGDIICKSLETEASELDFVYDTALTNTRIVNRLVIPGYYYGMDEVYAFLQRKSQGEKSAH